MQQRIRLKPDQISAITALYQQGATISSLAEQFGCNHKTIRRALKMSGIATPKRRGGLPKPDADTLRREYWEERQPSTMLAQKYGVSFGSICKWLQEYDIPRRSFSEAKKLDWERWDDTDRLKLTAASRAVLNWEEPSHAHLCQRAQGRERKKRLSTYEAMLLPALQARGLNPIAQFAIDKFNIDFAFPEQLLAVELHGGCWHNTPKKKAFDEAKRLFIEPLGWRILVIRARRKDWVNEAVANILDALMLLPLLIAQRE